VTVTTKGETLLAALLREEGHIDLDESEIGSAGDFRRAAAALDELLARPTGTAGEPSGFAAMVAGELGRARAKHAIGINSPHEGYAVIDEELDEFKRLVYGQDRSPDKRAAMLEELVQVAAMAQRCAEDWNRPSMARPRRARRCERRGRG
jgi:hypothetical protein